MIGIEYLESLYRPLYRNGGRVSIRYNKTYVDDHQIRSLGDHTGSIVSRITSMYQVTRGNQVSSACGLHMFCLESSVARRQSVAVFQLFQAQQHQGHAGVRRPALFRCRICCGHNTINGEVSDAHT